MTSLFFFGTLRDTALLAIVLGRSNVAGATPAHLPDYAVTWAKGQSFPMIAKAAVDSVEGLLVTDLSETDLARLDFYESGFEFDRTPVTVATDAGPVETHVYVPKADRWQPGAPWSLQAWQAQWGEVTRHAAHDVMEQFGRLSPAEMAFARPQILMRASAWVRAAAAQREITVGSDRSVQDVQTQARRRPYTKYFAVEEQEVRFARFDGSVSETVTRAAFLMGDAVTVLPYDPVRDRVLVIEQFRFAPLVRGDRQPWSLEPIAGRIDPGETPEQTARREAMEESNVALHGLELIGEYYPSPAAVTEYLYSYIGLADLPDDAAIIGGLDEEAEDIRGILLSFDALMALLQSGEMQTGPLMLSALWLSAHRDRLRAG